MRLSFGRYIPLNSPIHKMDPRFKLAMIILLIIAIFFPKLGYTGYIILSITIFGLYAASKLSWRMLSHVFIPTTIIFFVLLIINVFLMKIDTTVLVNMMGTSYNSDGGHVWLHGTKTVMYGEILSDKYAENGGWGFLNGLHVDDKNGNSVLAASQLVSLGYFYHYHALWLSERAFFSAFLMSWRIFLMITLTTIITATTQPLSITLGLEDLFSPLKWIGIPVHILSTIISIALRMIPDLMDEAGRIMKAQASRGIDMKNGKPGDKIRGMISLIIPLLVSSFQKAEDLANAMDARDYDPHAKRTRFHQFVFNWKDLVCFLIVSALAITMMVYGVSGSPIAIYTAQGMIPLHIPHIDAVTLY